MPDNQQIFWILNDRMSLCSMSLNTVSWLVNNNYMILLLLVQNFFQKCTFVIKSWKTPKKKPPYRWPIAKQSRASFWYLDRDRVPSLNPGEGKFFGGWGTKWKLYCLFPHFAINNYENKSVINGVINSICSIPASLLMTLGEW